MSHLSHTILCSPLQTLTPLNLSQNEIGDEGAQQLGMALKSIKVTQNQELSHVSHTILFSPLQTLTTLNRGYNQIGDEGSQHLAVALKWIKVRQRRTFLISHILLSFLPSRHLPPSISVIIESDLKVLSIWLRYYNRLR